MIAHEALNIQGIARSSLAKSTHDVVWGRFLGILHGKAEGAGVQVIVVSAATQQCSACRSPPAAPDQRKTLRDRAHRCPSCGFTADRDLTAAQTVFRLGRNRQALTSSLGGVA
jgi:putative transposase